MTCFQIVAWAVWTKMRDAKKMEQMVGLPVAPSFHQHLVVLADLYFQVMTCGKGKERNRVNTACYGKKRWQ